MATTVAYLGSTNTDEDSEADGFAAFLEVMGFGYGSAEEATVGGDGRKYVAYRVSIEKVEGDDE